MRTFASVVALALVSGCFGGDGDGYSDVRDAAGAVGQAFCERRNECGGDGAISDCVDGFIGSICSDRDCNAAPRGSSATIDTCIDALAVHSCTADNLPGECADIL